MTTLSRPSHYYTWHEETLPIGPRYQVSLKRFLITSSNNAYPGHNSLGVSPIGSLISASQTHLSDLSANTLLSPFVNCLCHSTSNTPSNVLGCGLHQTPSCKPVQRANQLPTVHELRLAQPITTRRASLAPPPKAHRVKPTNRIHSIAATKKLTKKGYISLIRTW